MSPSTILTTGLAYNFLIMMQLQQSMAVSVNGGVDFKPSFIRDIYSLLYNILNLDFFHFDELSFCLWKGAIFVYLFKHCKCGKNGCCHKKIITKYSLVQGLTAFIVISYFQCSWVTFMLLNRQLPQGIGGTHYKDVVFWNGSLQYFSTQHIFYAIPALLCLIFFVIPFPLILSFDGLLLKVEGKLADHFDFIRKLRPWTAIHYRSKPLLDSFQGTFKDQYRFFAGLYFSYRLLILALLVMVSNVLQYYFLLEVALTLIIVIQAIIQPFQEKNHNVCALLIFTNMALINTLTIRIFYLVSTDGYTTETILMQWIQVVLIYIPLIAGIVWGFWKLCKTCHSKYNASATNPLASSVDAYSDGYIAYDNDFPVEIFNRSESENDILKT
uniref:TRP C-terminal domain-containing protein n=1 Tax=Amphimedon queenslandica TaxID=400682 RepID=A0A1X7VAK1_AMPQE